MILLGLVSYRFLSPNASEIGCAKQGIAFVSEVFYIPTMATKKKGKRRKGPFAMRFNEHDLARLARLQERYETVGPTTTIREALKRAEQIDQRSA